MAALDGDDPDVDVVILTGADPGLLRRPRPQGAGLHGPQPGAPASARPASTGAAASAEQPAGPARGPWGQLSKPVIGAVNGVAITGGFELALCCDLLVASERARFADTHARVGVMPGWGLTVLLPQAVGIRRAREMSLTGNFMTADEALRVGLVNHVVDHDELLPFTRRLAADIVGNDQPGVRRILATYAAVADGTLAEGWATEAAMGRSWLADRDVTGGVAARREGIMARGRQQIELTANGRDPGDCGPAAGPDTRRGTGPPPGPTLPLSFAGCRSRSSSTASGVRVRPRTERRGARRAAG